MAVSIEGTRASKLMTEVQWGFPASCWLGVAAASFSTGTLLQHSSVLPGWLHSEALSWQHAIAAGPEASQKRPARGDPTMATANASVATDFSIGPRITHGSSDLLVPFPRAAMPDLRQDQRDAVVPAVFGRLEDTTAIVETVARAAHTRHAGDGKIFAGPVSQANRVRTSESGENAVLCTAHPAPAAEAG